jgi:Glycosyl transferases group 1
LIRRYAQILRRRSGQAIDPAVWRIAAADIAWRVAGRCPPPASQSAFARQVSVRWPNAYKTPDASHFCRTLLRGLDELVGVTRTGIAQPWNGVVVFQLQVDGAIHDAAIDYTDSTALNASCADSVGLYYKMQYVREGYGRANVVPGGYVTPRMFLHENYCRLRDLRKDRDCEVYGRFGLRFSSDLRAEAVHLLGTQQRFTYDGATFTYDHGGGMLVYGDHLRRAARARVCVDLPGNGPFCYRLVDYLGTGSCIVAVRHAARLPVDLVEGEHIAWCEPDLSDLVERCAFYVENDEARRAMSENAARYFDRNLHYRSLAAYYLATGSERFG